MPARALRLGLVLLALVAAPEVTNAAAPGAAPEVTNAAAPGAANGATGGAAGAAATAPGPLATTPACPDAGAYAVSDAPLPALAAALRAPAPVEILAIGSASTAAADGYPQHLLAALRAARPGSVFHLTVRGARGLLADESLALLRAALHERRAPLVLWQVGTVEAVRGVRPEAMVDALEAGAAAVARQGGDLVLIDPQYSRFLEANVDLDPYQQAIASVAGQGGVVLFHRFALMRDWADAGTLDLERTVPKARAAVAARLAECVGTALARFVLSGAGAH